MEYIACELCGYASTEKVLTVCDLRFKINGSFNLVRCKQCDLLYINPRPTREEIGKYYPMECHGTDRPLDKDLLNSYYSQNVDKVYKEINIGQRGRLLDVGCGRGFFGHLMQLRGWEVYGIEINRRAAEFAQKEFGFPVFVGDLLDSDFSDEYFDLVTFWHVLEHLHNPKRVLERTRQILRQNGRVIITVPTIDNMLFKIFKQNYYVVSESPRHLYQFSTRTLAAILINAGFNPMHMQKYRGDKNHILFSIYNLLRLPMSNTVNRTGKEKIVYFIIKLISAMLYFAYQEGATVWAAKFRS